MEVFRLQRLSCYCEYSTDKVSATVGFPAVPDVVLLQSDGREGRSPAVIRVSYSCWPVSDCLGTAYKIADYLLNTSVCISGTSKRV